MTVVLWRPLLEVLHHSKSSELSRKQLDASTAARVALTDELAEQREIELHAVAQTSSAMHDTHVAQEAVLGVKEREAEASSVAAEALERQRAKAQEDQHRFRELEAQHQQLLDRTRKKAAEETARRASAERKVKEMSDEISRRKEADSKREQEAIDYKTAQDEQFLALEEEMRLM